MTIANTKKLLLPILGLVLTLWLSTGCSGSTPTAPTTVPPTSAPTVLPPTSLPPTVIATVPAETIVPAPAASPAVIDPAAGEKYEPVSPSVCQMLQELATQALAIDFKLEASAPFLDTIAGEAGQGCRLTANGNGTQFTSPQSALAALVSSAGLGWTEQPGYQADGPTGTATAFTRDMALMLIQAGWAPAIGVVCPTDQPISACNLTPEQKAYTIQIDVAQYRADFSLDGHWEDAATGFSLDLYQDWKNIYGHHEVVAQGGNKIDTLEVSINGRLKGQVAEVQFQSSFADDLGTAQITYIDVNTITWKIITPPNGEYYLPAEARLTRK